MLWLAWRQFRAQAALAFGAIVIVITALVATRGHVVDTYSATGDGDLTGFYVWLRLLGTALIGVPAVIGAFWGAPLLTREFEDRTYRMVWTQSVTRNRWLATKLAVVAVVAVASVAAFALVFTWWTGPIDSTGNRIGSANFAQRGIVPIGYALFGLALGALAGIMVRRTIPAMAASLTGFFVVRIVVQKLVRTHLIGTNAMRIPSFGSNELHGWIVSTRTVDAAGQTISTKATENVLAAACNITRATPNVDAALAACAENLGIHDIAQVHTSDQFWVLQTAELGLFIALAAITASVCFWWLNHRID
jgi:ABC-type transport system involved in multi-copper enzyme maturation permease subunit